MFFAMRINFARQVQQIKVRERVKGMRDAVEFAASFEYWYIEGSTVKGADSLGFLNKLHTCHEHCGFIGGASHQEMIDRKMRVFPQPNPDAKRIALFGQTVGFEVDKRELLRRDFGKFAGLGALK